MTKQKAKLLTKPAKAPSPPPRGKGKSTVPAMTKMMALGQKPAKGKK